MTIRPFRVWQALIAAAASAMLLAACGGGADDAAAPPPEESTAETSDGGSVDSEPSASDGGRGDSEPSASDDGGRGDSEPSASDDGGQGEPNEATTTISFVWPDDSWQIEELDENPCANGFISPSPFGDGPDYFTCGPTAAGLIACHATDGETLCVQNHADKQAVRFRSPEADGFSAPPPEDGASPVGAVLEDGTTCNLVAHDHMPHAEGRSSWLHCEDGESALLTLEEGSMEYFDTTEQPWKAELGVGTEEPTIVEVSDVIYLATPEDAQVDD